MNDITILENKEYEYEDEDGDKVHIVHVIRRRTKSYIIHSYQDQEIVGSGALSEDDAQRQIDYSLKNGFSIIEQMPPYAS